jgi:biopolymer transport protein ExbB
MYYGNTAAKGGMDSSGTYDINQVAVYNFNELSSGPKDHTAYSNNPSYNDAEANPASFIGAGIKLDGKGQKITIPMTPSMRVIPSQGWTISNWIKPSTVEGQQAVMEIKDGDRSLSLKIQDGYIVANYYDENGSFQTSRGLFEAEEQWVHLSMIVKDDSIMIYLNAEEIASGQGTIQELAGELTLGVDSQGVSFQGEIDEVRISNVNRTKSWLIASVSNQGVGSAMLKYGGDEKNETAGAGTSYFNVILQNVTVDGWVVIVLLGIMGAISWVVMVGKWILIERVRKDDKAFLSKYHDLGSAEPDKLDHEDSEEEKEFQNTPLTQALIGKHDHFQSSSIYRIYHAGIQEAHNRLGKSVGAQAAALSPQAVNTIRAILDATQVRETQKLNNLIVLLTIAISGGPFLGLLGTVVGVMITFAAIAASGDVNVNAIAPGIAAALMATVAGLAVAIPALFGYNYLNTKIKESTADMQVFIDEFIAKIAEHYA